MLVDKTNFGLVLYNHANFYQFEELSSYWSVARISVFLGFALVNQRHTSVITVYKCTVTNIENTLRAVHSCNGWLFLSVNSIGLRSVVDTSVNFEPIYPGFESDNCIIFFMFVSFFFVIIITVQIQHYCLYSDSASLLPLMMGRPPAPSAL